jgi:4-amino-4-deoxy-L-arabinose transferase-like glycosyltransferase
MCSSSSTTSTRGAPSAIGTSRRNPRRRRFPAGTAAIRRERQGLVTSIEYMAITTLQRGTEDPSPTDLGTAPIGTDLEARAHRRRPERALRSLARGRANDPAWVRPALLVLLVVTATLYLWDLGASGWANSFYSAAVQAGTKSWKAFFFGSSDSSNFITVDKPPAALWVMEISARIFGLSSWSLLVPQALEGVAAVAVVYATVRRWSSAGAGLLAGAVMALTPVAALMFRYNNPDSLLVLLLCGAAYATTRAIEKASTRWLIFAFSLVGLGFITKMMQAFLIVPALAGAYFLAAPTTLLRRARQLVAAGAAMLVSAGWWVVAVMAVPAADRPYIGGSQDNSLWNLIFGYNGFGRLTGNESGSVVGGAATGTSRWGPTGLTRLFGTEMGSQISWLLPAALLLLAVGLVVTLRRARTDRTRAALVLWGGWLLVTGLVFSLAQGIIHPYYTVALAPAIAAIVGIGTWELWSRRSALWARLAMGATVLATSVWSVVLLDRVPKWHPELRPVILAAGCVAAALIALSPYMGRRSTARFAQTFALSVAAIAVLAAPAAYTLDTVTTPYTGAIPSAGPASANTAGSFGGPGGGGGGGGGFEPGRTGQVGTGTQRGLPRAGQFPPGGGQAGAATGRGNPGGNLGGLLNSSTPSKAITTALKADASKYTWVAAAVGSNESAGYQLASGEPVMAIGGFNGTDPDPSLAQFEKYLSEGKIHYFIASGGSFGAGPGSSSASSDDASLITSWVESHFTATTIGGVTVYNLTSGER